MLISMHVIVSYLVDVECRLSMLSVVAKEPSNAREDVLEHGIIPLNELTKVNPLKLTIFLYE